MISYPKHYQILPEFDNTDWLIQQADQVLSLPIPHITDSSCPRSAGGIHDFYSEADYWWPDPSSPNGLPYIQHDGETNPDNFTDHRILLRKMRTYVVFLSCAWKLTGEERYADRAVQILKEFFLDENTRMNPHLNYAQAIGGICTGRGIGVIDTLHLIDVPFAIEALRNSSALTENLFRALQDWFSSYLGWMLTSRNGVAEMNTTNNHCICFFAQAATFACFTDNQKIVDFCRSCFKNDLMRQMTPEGTFPRELGRTKPYNYSLFALDNLTTLCHLLSTPEDNLWEYVSERGSSMSKALDFITPYVLDKSTWPYPKDVMHFDSFPVRYSFLMFAGCTLGRQELINRFQSLSFMSEDEEALRNLAIRQPMLWM